MFGCRKLKDQERQGQLIRERIEERKKRKQQQQQETTMSDGCRSGIFVVNVSESNDAQCDNQHHNANASEQIEDDNGVTF